MKILFFSLLLLHDKHDLLLLYVGYLLFYVKCRLLLLQLEVNVVNDWMVHYNRQVFALLWIALQHGDEKLLNSNIVVATDAVDDWWLEH